MGITPIIETAISITLLYLLFSQVTLSINELWSGLRNSRGKFLHEKLLRVLGTKYTKSLYEDPVVKQLMTKPDRYPPYISDKLFAETIINSVIFSNTVATNEHPNTPAPVTDPLNQFSTALTTKMQVNSSEAVEKDFNNILNGLLTQAQGSQVPFEQLKSNLMTWYHEYGLRMSGWYKMKERVWLLLIGLVIAILADIDSIRLIEFISSNDNARAALVTLGVKTSDGKAPDANTPSFSVEDAAIQKAEDSIASHTATLSQSYKVLEKQVLEAQQMGLPLGFDRGLSYIFAKNDSLAIIAKKNIDAGMPDKLKRFNDKIVKGQPANYNWKSNAMLWMILGWIMTGIAMMIGAPFWFDVLCRFVNIRTLGAKPTPTPGE